MLNANPSIPFVQFKMELGKILGTSSKKPAKAVSTNTLDNDYEDEPEQPSAKRVKKEDNSDLEAQIAQVLKENRLLREKWTTLIQVNLQLLLSNMSNHVIQTMDRDRTWAL